jgi:hypothetical protein
MASENVSDQFFFPNGDNNTNRYNNPFYGIPLQYLPQNIDAMLWWSNHFLLRFSFYRTALSKVANYFITQLNIECDDDSTKKDYQEIFEKMHWKEILQETGLNLLAYGNAFVSINQGFNRFLSCPKCPKFTRIDKVDNFKFAKGIYSMQCPSCGYKGNHRLIDKHSTDINKITCTNWNPREIKIRFEDTTKEMEYLWEIPELYKLKITNPKDKFYPRKTPKVVYDAIYGDKMIKFNEKNFVHIKIATPAALKTDGKAIPYCMYMFDSFFMLKVLERFNEVICFEDINPFRVIAMADNTPSSHPALANQDGGTWAAAVDDMISQHRRDPGSYQKFPFTFSFQHLGGDGKNLAPIELIEHAQNNILNALNIPQELFTMQLGTQAVGPALRLFENSWSHMIDGYNTLLQHIGDVISRIKGLTPGKFSIMPVTFADDMERKSVISSLVSSNSIARSELLKLFGYEWKDQVRKKMQEDIDTQELQQEEQDRQQLRKTNMGNIFDQQQAGPQGSAMMGGESGGTPAGTNSVGSGVGMSPQDILAQAQEIAQQLYPKDGAERRTELQKIKATNETLWGAVKAALAKLTGEAKSQGVEQSKQQQ